MNRPRGPLPGPESGQQSLFEAPGAPGTAPHRGLIGAVELARRLGQAHPPTPEQVRAIEHPGTAAVRPALAPFLVVAGAGSGKTETMAARVVWLVANRLVRPERVLGLTFTRKAAGELAERVRQRLRQLAASGPLHAGADEPGDDWLLGDPTIATYHAYAGRLVTEHALRVGREPSARLLGEASTWQYAGRVVGAWDGDMSGVEWAPATVIGAVRALASDLSEHLVEPDDVRGLVSRFDTLIASLPDGTGKSGTYASALAFLKVLRAREQLLPLVEAYTRRKAATDALDHGDQVALAARIARGHPGVGEIERDRFDVVLLDEYQDTGTAQRVLLAHLFGQGHPVTAVGDPCQSIYGWRGASAGNLARFPSDFPARASAEASRDAVGGGSTPSDVVDLTTSFRNGGRILAVANAVSAPLRAQGVPVSDLRPGPRGESSGHVVHACLSDVDAEAAWIAERVEALLGPAAGLADDDGTGPTGSRPTPYAPRDIAVLARARSQFDAIERALRGRGIPVEVSGLGGLLSTPEVTDVVATLHVLSDPGAGAALLRLLTGARWRVGARDLESLSRRARDLARPTDPRVASVLESAPEGHDPGSLVEALDDPGGAQAYSAQGHRRIDALRRELAELRGRWDQPLPDLVADIVRTMHLNVEVAARPGAEPGAARGHLDRLLDVAADFAEAEEAPSVPAFLAYLEAAADYERGLDAGRVGVPGDAVQLLTIHGSKGLEWPVVIVPGLVKGTFPGRAKESSDWCGNARLLPFPLRGDAGDLPVLGLEACGDQREVHVALEAHKQRCRDRELLEERRLLYVAVTRAEDLLLCTGYWWGRGSTVKGPSAFLTEVAAVCAELGVGTDAGWAPAPEAGVTNPLAGEPRSGTWPRPPDPGRHGLAEAAALVQAAARDLAAEPGSPGCDGPLGSDVAAEAAPRVLAWSDEVDKLLAERARLRATPGVVDVVLPVHLSVSQLVALRRDPQQLARWIRRPVPVPPAPLARRGTAFHGWLESRFHGDRLLDIDELPGSADPDAASDADLETLKAAFLTSAWAHRQPIEVEVPFETRVGGLLVRGRADAVFREPDGTDVILDWKTGRVPSGADADAAAVQLAAYRLAWHRLTGVPLESVGAAFHYVRSDVTVRPVDLLDADGLLALVAAVPLVGDPPARSG